MTFDQLAMLLKLIVNLLSDFDSLMIFYWVQLNIITIILEMIMGVRVRVHYLQSILWWLIILIGLRRVPLHSLKWYRYPLLVENILSYRGQLATILHFILGSHWRAFLLSISSVAHSSLLNQLLEIWCNLLYPKQLQFFWSAVKILLVNLLLSPDNLSSSSDNRARYTLLFVSNTFMEILLHCRLM